MLHPISRIQFHSLIGNVPLQHRKQLKEFISSIFSGERQSFQSLAIIFCSDETLLAINQEFLSHNYFTDIITFNLADHGPIVGELYISLERVRENSRTLQQAVKTELHRVIFHGVLHLCGYKDKTTKQIEQMRTMEAKYLRSYFK